MPPEEDFSDDESYYVPAGTAPARVVRGPSVKDMQLYGSENGDLLRAQRERQLALRQQGAEHARVHPMCTPDGRPGHATPPNERCHSRVWVGRHAMIALAYG